MRIFVGPCFSSFINHRHLSTGILIIPRMDGDIDGSLEWKGVMQGAKETVTHCGRYRFKAGEGRGAEGTETGSRELGGQKGSLGKVKNQGGELGGR